MIKCTICDGPTKIDRHTQGCSPICSLKCLGKWAVKNGWHKWADELREQWRKENER